VTRQACSGAPSSLLVRHFTQRSGLGPTTRPERVMCALVESVRRRRIRNVDERLYSFSRDRYVTEIEIASDLGCDGVIEPLGKTFPDGFRIRLRKGMPDARVRFTLAHEVCHTFFYELVPEIKFFPHGRDSTEERLCNLGAAAFLVPTSSLKRDARSLPPCLESLDLLSSKYGVSLPTMALRLGALGQWKCRLSIWRRMGDGSFALDRLYGAKEHPWKWQDDSVLERGWQSTEPLFGETALYHVNARGYTECKPILYEVRRTGNDLVVLWGDGIRRPLSTCLPLFGKASHGR
jgi:IrrE N-terminal-like domain